MGPPWLKDVQEKFNSFLLLEQDWDSYEAPPINPACIDRAMIWLSQLPSDTPEPFSMPTGGGGVGVEWGHGEDWAIVEWELEGDSVGCASWEEDFDLNKLLPLQKTNLLERIFP
jgi:hypothetical protein